MRRFHKSDYSTAKKNYRKPITEQHESKKQRRGHSTTSGNGMRKQKTVLKPLDTIVSFLSR